MPKDGPNALQQHLIAGLNKRRMQVRGIAADDIATLAAELPGIQLGYLLGGSILIETVFSWPGLGKLTYEAISGPDLPLLQGTFVVFSAIIILMNLAADFVYRVLDPRVRR